MTRRSPIIVFCLILSMIAAGCTAGPANKVAEANTEPQPTESPMPAATPSKQLTEADVAKLNWLEGSWKGMDGQKPFFQRIKFEGSNMIIETYPDESMSKASDTARFELKDGEFGRTLGDQRSAASSIIDGSVQFVPAAVQSDVPAKGSTFRFDRKPDGTWTATLETPASGSRPASEKVYTMEPLKTAK